MERSKCVRSGKADLVFHVAVVNAHVVISICDRSIRGLYMFQFSVGAVEI